MDGKMPFSMYTCVSFFVSPNSTKVPGINDIKVMFLNAQEIYVCVLWDKSNLKYTKSVQNSKTNKYSSVLSGQTKPKRPYPLHRSISYLKQNAVARPLC